LNKSKIHRGRSRRGHVPSHHGSARSRPKIDAPGPGPKVSRSLAPLLAQIGIPEPTPFVPDPFQREAISLAASGDVVVSAPTGVGKTWIAQQAIARVLESGGRCWYASPLKALSNAIFSQFSDLFGADRVGILTGDRKENPGAPLIVGTTEILRNQLYDAMTVGLDIGSDLVVLDEAHYLGDPDRGVVWEEVMIYLPARVRLLMLSATVANAREIAAWLALIRDRVCHTVLEEHRPVPLHPVVLFPDGRLDRLTVDGRLNPAVSRYVERRPKSRTVFGVSPPHGRLLSLLEEVDLAPAIFFLKSRAECDAAVLRCSMAAPDVDKDRVLQDLTDDFLNRYPFMAGYGPLRTLRRRRVAAHHAGHLPHWKLLIEQVMKSGLLRAIFATSTVAAGVNFPARSVVVLNSDKFDGHDFKPLTAKDLQQMTGRAGRRGMDDVGFAVFVTGPFMDLPLAAALMNSRPEPIGSQMRINFSMTLNLLMSHRPVDIEVLLKRSFAAFQEGHRDGGRDQARITRLMDRMAERLEGTGCSGPEEALIRSRRAEELGRLLESLDRETPVLVQRLRREAGLAPGRVFVDARDRIGVIIRPHARYNQPGRLAAMLKSEHRKKPVLSVQWLPLDKALTLLDEVLDPPPGGPDKALARTLDQFRHHRPPTLGRAPGLSRSHRRELAAHLRRVRAVKKDLAALPCRQCKGDCFQGPLADQIRELEGLLALLEQGGRQLWLSLLSHLEFLKAEGFADAEGRLTPDGQWASQLRLDQPLSIAEAIRTKNLPEDDPALMAALIAPFVDERDKDVDPPGLVAAVQAQLRPHLARLTEALLPLHERMRAAGFSVPAVHIGPAAALFLWCQGAAWERLLSLCDWDQGDLVNLIFRTADNLRQVAGLTETHPGLAQAAALAVERILRPPVVVPT
jgi:ATP-dependent RNA helicase HelY